MGEQRRGFLLGAAAYAMWGAFPLYWPHLEPAGALEILAHRVLWSMVTMAVLVLALRRTAALRAVLHSRRTTTLLVVAAAAVTVNWATYIWGVNHGLVVETSLGYFVNPLVTVLLGVVVLGERLRSAQWAALGLAMVAVGVLTLDYGHPPYVALVLAGSFGVYGLLKKTAGVGALESLAIETTAVAPLAGLYLVVLSVTGGSHFTSAGTGHAALLASSGVVTALPLICFGAAATRVSLTTLGLLQYLAPIFQFALGVLYFHEQMTTGRWIGFALVWLALVVLTVEAVGHHRRRPRASTTARAGAEAGGVSPGAGGGSDARGDWVVPRNGASVVADSGPKPTGYQAERVATRSANDSRACRTGPVGRTSSSDLAWFARSTT